MMLRFLALFCFLAHIVVAEGETVVMTLRADPPALTLRAEPQLTLIADPPITLHATKEEVEEPLVLAAPKSAFAADPSASFSKEEGYLKTSQGGAGGADVCMLYNTSHYHQVSP
jgi:hypothetical protein